jgi:fructose-bisphosphate aldolase/2-amino-3,7-dideoxy-D-threo-hept-6-ulosonate synthase
VARACERLGIPLIVETLARGKGLTNPSSAEWLKLHTRIAVELGADVLKTDYTGDAETMREVLQTCPAPILVLGGAQKPEAEFMKIVKGSVAAGAAGLTFGRNVFQSSDVVGTLRKLRATLDEPAN